MVVDGGRTDLTRMLLAGIRGGERASAFKRERGAERAYVQQGGRVGQTGRERGRTSGWVL